MLSFLFFFGIPVFFGFLQFFVTRSRKLSPGKKYLPLLFVCLVAVVTWPACFGYLPLPKTFFFDGNGGFLPFPDFVFVALFCFPALFGLMLGAIFGVGIPREE